MRNNLRRAVFGIVATAFVAIPWWGFAELHGQEVDSSLFPILPTTEIQKGPRPNVTVVDPSPLPKDKAPQLEYINQRANFILGKQITGQQSNATAIVFSDLDRGREGTLTLQNVEGEFIANELITGAEGGGATAASSLREGIWILDFAFKPLRTRRVQIPGLGRRQVLYLYYRVVNHTGADRIFVPQLFLEAEDGTRYRDRAIPQAIPLIKAREDDDVRLLGTVDAMGTLPLSTSTVVDQGIYGVALWVLDDTIAKSDKLSIYVRGLSDGVQEIEAQTLANSDDGSDVRYKTLRIDFERKGDRYDFSEREIKLLGTEWIYD